MRKTLILILAITMILAIPVQASAVTPSIRIPSIKIPTISPSIEVRIPDNYFVENPIELPENFKLPFEIKFDFDFKFS